MAHLWIRSVINSFVKRASGQCKLHIAANIVCKGILLLTVPHCTVVRYCMFSSHFCVMVTLAQNLRSERNYTDIFPFFQKDFIYWQSESKTEMCLPYNLLSAFIQLDTRFSWLELDFYNSILAFYNSILVFSTRYLLFITRYSTFVTRYSLFITRYSLFITWYSTFITRYSMFTTRNSLFFTRNSVL